MSIHATIVTSLVDTAPGDVVQVVVELTNDGDTTTTVFASPVGLGASTPGGDSADQRFEVPANDRIRIAVRVPVPSTLGIGQHAAAIQLTQPGAERPRLVGFTLSVASVQRVAMRSTPGTLRARRRAAFDLDLVNNESHPVELMLGADGDDVSVRFRDPSLTLLPGQRGMTRGRVRARPRLFGDDVQHNVKVTAQGRASRTSLLVPFVQRPLFARRMRSLVAALVVVGLWASLAGGAIIWFRDRNADDQRARSAAELDAGDAGALAPIDGSPGDGPRDDASAADDLGDDGGGSGDGDAPSDDLGDDGGGETPDGADAGDGTDDSDGTADTPGGVGTDGADGNGTADGAGAAVEADNTVVVRGTVDLDGDVSGVTITPSPMTLQDVAGAQAAAFALAEQPMIRKIWSARAGFGGPTIQLAQSGAVPAGPFAPDADGIWGVELPVNQTYELAFRRSGFEPQSFVVAPEVGKQIELAVQLVPASGALGGTVTGAGRALENVKVIVTDGRFDYETVTDANGSWGLTGVSSSDAYTVVATLEGFGADARLVTLGPGEQRDDVDLALTFGETVLIGSAVDSVTGDGLGGVAVTVVNGTDSRSTTTLTDGDVGAFRIPQLAARARYSVTAELEGYRTATTSVTLGFGATSIDPLRLEPLAATLGGTLIDSATGAPITAAGIQLTRDDLPAPVASVQTVNEGQPGSFTLGKVPPGRYLLTVEHWQHATVRHDLVVESATVATLDPNDPARAQAGPTFALMMDPIDTATIGNRPTGNLSLRVRDADESRACPLTPLDVPRPEEQCSAIFGVTVQIITTDAAFIQQAEAGTGPFVKRTMSVRDPATGVVSERDIYVFACSPDSVCNSGDDFPDYTIRGVPVGSYSVRLTHPDYNPRTIPVTIRPAATQSETVNMARLGEVIGTVIDSSQRPDEVSILGTSLVTVLIVNANNPAVVFQTRIIDGTFQTDDEARLPPGSYRVEVDAFGLGYYVDPDQDVDGDIDTGGLRFDIAAPDPDNPGSGRVVLAPILADPYPEVEARVFAPSGITPAGDDPPVTFSPITGTPAATLQCVTETSVAVTAAVSDQTVRFDKATVATLDSDRDGRLTDCTMTVTTDDHETIQHTFGATNAAGVEVADLQLATDRFLDVALIRTSSVARQPRGTLEWIDAGRPTPANQQAVPVVGATVTASNVVTALVPSDAAVAPDAGAPAAVDPYRPTLDPVTTALDGSVPPSAVWDFGGVRQLVGEARFDIDADGFPGGSLFVAIDAAGQLTTRVETDPDVTGDPDVADGSYDVVLAPDPGTIRGRATVYTSDAVTDVTSVAVSTSINGTGTQNPTVGAAGAFSAGVDAGTWLTTVTAPAHHAVIDADPEDLTGCLPPGVTSPSQLTVGSGAASFRQCVPPGGVSAEAEVELVELGSLSIEFVDTADPANPIDAADAGVEYRFDGGTATTATTDTIDVDDVAVPLDPALYGPGEPLPAQQHRFSIVDAGPYDLRSAVVSVFRVSRADPAVRTPVTSGVVTGMVDIRQDYTLSFVAGDKYVVRVQLPQLGTVTATLPAVDSVGGSVPICTDPAGTPPGVRATVVAIPVVQRTEPIPDPIFGFTFEQVWVIDTAVDEFGPIRSNIEAMTCGDLVLQGVQGTYALTATHPEFTSSHPSFVPTYPSNRVGGVPVVTIPASGAIPSELGTLPAPVLTLRPTRVEIDAVDQLDGAAVADAYYVISRNGTDLVGPALVDDPLSATAWEAELDPGAGYRVEVRGCATAPLSMLAFDACVERFPAALPFEVGRSSGAVAELVIEVPLLAVGGSIEVTLVFENSRDRPVCPRSVTLSVDRLFTSAVTARVGDGTVPADTVTADRSETQTTTFAAAPQTTCIDDVGERELVFDQLVPTGRHRFTLPAVSGFAAPTVVNGTAPESSDGAYITDVDVVSLDPTAVTVRYEALAVTVELRICGERDAAPRCNERFPDLAASLTEPGDGGDTVPATSVSDRNSTTGYTVRFEDIVPDAAPHQLGITDRLHDNALTRAVLVQPGTNTYANPFTFSGRAIRVAVRPLLQNVPTPTGPLQAGVATIVLRGRNSPTADWTFISDTPQTCSIENSEGVPVSYECFEDDSYGDYLVTVNRESYVGVQRQYLGVRRGDTIVEEVTLVKRARLQVNARLDNGATPPPPFPAALNPLVGLVRTSDGSATGVDPIPHDAFCQAATGCFQFYADPGVAYRFETGATDAYLPASTAAITATIGMTPATMPGGIPTLTFVQRAVLQVTATAYDAEGDDALAAFPDALASLVLIEVIAPGTGTTDPIATSSTCAAASGCFRFYADPGSSYRFRTGTTSSYLPDISATIAATTGMTPASGGSATLEFRPRVVTVTVTANGLTITAVKLTIGSSTFSDTSAPYLFTSLATTLPIPIAGTGSVVVEVSNGRNRGATVTEPPADSSVQNYTLAVSPYQTLNGSVDANVPVGATIRAQCGATCSPSSRTTTVDADRKFTFSGASGLDVNPDGSSLDWIIEVMDGSAALVGASTVTVTVDATTAVNPATPALQGPAPPTTTAAPATTTVPPTPVVP